MNKTFSRLVAFTAGVAVCAGLGAGTVAPAFADNDKNTSTVTEIKEVASVLNNSNLDGVSKKFDKGSSIKLSGTLNGGTRKIEIKEYNYSTKQWKVIKSINTNSSGTFSHTVTPSASTTYYLYAPAIGGFKSFTGKPTNFNINPTSLTKTKLTVKILDGKTKYYKKGTKLTISGTVTGGARTVNVVKYNTKNKKWNVVATAKSDSKGTYSIPYTLNDSGNYSVSVPITSSHTAIAGTSTNLTTQTIKPKISTVRSSYSHAVPWSPGEVSGVVSSVPSNSAYTATIQQKTKNSWKDVSTHKNLKSGTFSLSLPKGSKNSGSATNNYRIKYSGNGMTTVYSNTFKVVWNNPLKGTATEKKIYNYIKSYCPDTPITVKSLSDWKAWGLAEIGTKNTVLIDPKVPASHLETVSLHECAHFTQWKQYGKDWDKFKEDMNKVHGAKGTVGMEQNADCIANYWKKNTYWGYKGDCKGNKATVEKAIANGKKYNITPVVPSKPKQVFTDVSSKDIFQKEIEELATKNITNGWTMPNGTKQYRPYENVKRDAMIAFIYRAMGSPSYTPPKKSPFTDVSTSNIFYKEIAWAYDEGIAEGWKMKDGTRQFRPLQNVKRDAMAAFLMRAAGEEAPKSNSRPFADVPTNLIFADEIRWMKETGISTGWKHNNTYQPLSNTKRDAMAAFMIRWMDHTGYKGS